MNNIHLDTKHQVFWLSYDYLLDKNISQGTLNSWSTRKTCKRKYINRRAYINYDTIPEETREKLPTKEGLKEEYSRQKSEYFERWFTHELKAAYKSDRLPVWVNAIMNDGRFAKLKRDQVTCFARRAAVIEKAIEFQEMHNAKGRLTGLFYAYSSIYPNDYT